MDMDWKDKLGAAFGISEPLPDETPETPAKDDAVTQQGGNMVNIVLDKKGRNGKKATIITDLRLDDETIKELASDLKRHCGVGGSARGEEILIQGDARDKVLAYLKEKGFMARII